MDASKVGKNQSNYFARKQRKFVEENEKKIDQLKKNYKQQEIGLKSNNQLQIEKIRANHDKTIIDATEQKEERLGKIKKDYETTNKALESSKKQLMMSHDNAIKTLKGKNNIKINQENFRNQSNIDDLNYRTKRALDEIRFQENEAIQDQVLNFAKQKTELQSSQKSTISTQNSNFKNEFNNKEALYNRSLTQQRLEFENRNLENEKKFDQEITDTKKEKQSQLNNQIELFDNKMIEAKKSFISNYNALKDRQQIMYDNLEQQGNKKIEMLNESTTQKVELFNSKKEDKFYTAIDLTPKIKDKEKEYEISFKIPEYEKGQINLSAYDRKVRVTFSREHKEEGRTPSGFYGKTQKSESILNEFQLPEIMEGKEIKKKFAENKVTFIVPKK